MYMQSFVMSRHMLAIILCKKEMSAACVANVS